MQFDNYWALAFLLLIPFAFYTYKASQIDLPLWRKRTVFVFRIVAILSLVLAVSGLKIVHKSDSLSVMFALDVSHSIPESERELAINQADEIAKLLKDDDEAGLITFARQANVQIPLQNKLFFRSALKNLRAISSNTSALDQGKTNISNAIRLASGIFPEGRIKRLVILSDGNENSGDSAKDAELAASMGIEIDTLPLTPLKGDEVLLDQVYIPNNVRLNQAFEVKVMLKSLVKAKARLQIYRNRNYLGQKELSLLAGKREIVIIPQLLTEEGIYQYQFLLEADRDTILENNRGSAVIVAKGAPQLLYLEGDPENSKPFQEAMATKNISFFPISVDQFPNDLKELQKYEVLILSDVAAEGLSPRQMKLIQTYVRDLGNGLIMIGGDRSFGAGGYFNTPVEATLPLNMDPRKNKDSVAIVLILDKSGSMANLSGGYEKMEFAKEAAISAVEFLKTQDKIGVIAFDSQAKEVVKLSSADRKQEITSQIGTIRAGGGTKITSALKKAHAWLKADKSKFKHAILLSDGQAEENLADIAAEIASDDITLSTISIGDDASNELMKKVGEAGGGRWYATKDVSDLPRIFVREAFLASELFVEGKFKPKAVQSDLLIGIDPDEIPPLLGYVSTSEKKTAQVHVRSHLKDPILATWRYGLGRALAFTSDAKAKWAVEWLEWDKFAKFWSQVINWTLPSVSNRNFEAIISVEGNKGKLIIESFSSPAESPDYGIPQTEFQATVTAIDDLDSVESQVIPISQTTIGRFEGEFDVSKKGSYIARIDQSQGGVQLASQTVGISIPYSAEFKALEPDAVLLNKLSNLTKGHFSVEPQIAARRSGKSTGRPEALWQLLTLIALILLPIEVAIRRLSVSRRELGLIRNKLGWESQPTSKVPSGFETLKKRRTEALNMEAQSRSVSPRPSQSQGLVRGEGFETQGEYTGRLLQAKRRAMGR